MDEFTSNSDDVEWEVDHNIDEPKKWQEVLRMSHTRLQESIDEFVRIDEKIRLYTTFVSIMMVFFGIMIRIVFSRISSIESILDLLLYAVLFVGAGYGLWVIVSLIRITENRTLAKFEPSPEILNWISTKSETESYVGLINTMQEGITDNKQRISEKRDLLKEIVEHIQFVIIILIVVVTLLLFEALSHVAN